MAPGRGRGSISRVGKSSVRSNPAIRVNMPTIPIPTTISPQQGGTTSIGGSDRRNQVQTLVSSSMPVVQTTGHDSTPTMAESSPVAPNQSNPIGNGTCTQRNPVGEGASTQRNTMGEVNSSSGHTRTLITLTSAGLQPSKTCSNCISESFKNEVDPNGISWKGISNDTKDCYFGEFKKHFYWYSSIDDSVVKKIWMAKAAQRYKDFISKIKKKRIKPTYVPENVWESWMQLWEDSKNVEKSETNAKNRRGSGAVAAGTHTGGSISMGEHRKRHAVQMGRDPTPSELHLHVHTHGHDGKSFIDERSRIVHEKYKEILREKIESQSDIDQSEAYYQAVGGEKKRKVYGLGSEAKNYYGQNLRVSSSSVPPSVSHESAPTTNMDEFVKQLIPALIDNFLPIVVERVQEVGSSPVVPTPATTNGDEVDPSVSDDDRSPSPVH